MRFLLAFAVVATYFSPAVAADQYTADVVIYGGTSAAVTAAVQVKQMGKSALIVCPDKHLGGLTSGGLGWTDSGKKDAIGGLSRQFYHRVWKYYQDADAWTFEDQSKFGNRNQSPPSKNGDGSTMWVFEPHVAEAIFEDYIEEYDIPVHRDEWLDRTTGKGVTKKNGRIQSITMKSGNTYVGKMFLDTTYEGDLIAAAGVDYHVGREANSVYNEKWNGVQVGVLHHGHHFKKPVSPYRTPGDPDSGLLPHISDEPPGKKGEGDHRLQAYCFRMCLTNVDENRIPFPKPSGYDPDEYELLVRVFESGWRQAFNKFDPIPNHKTDTNNHGPFSTDKIGENYDYPEATYERRREIIKEHEDYQKGLMYFLANDPRVPDEIRTKMAKWGLAKDEFTDNGGWPHQIYVREARRMIGDYVMTEHDVLDEKVTPNSVGMGSYTLDSHNVQRYIKPDGYVQNEGDIGVHVPRPYEISYGSLVPKKSQCENLLVPVCVSSSHIAFGSIRMEPVFMILGQSAATAACMAIDQAIAVQEVPYPELRERLLKDGQVLELTDPDAILSRKLPGVVVDDRQAEKTGQWKSSSTNRAFVDAGYIHNDNTEQGKKSVVFKAELKPGRYEVRMSYAPNNNRATNVPVAIHHADGTTLRTVNERQKPDIDGVFVSLGTYTFDAANAWVQINTDETDGYVVVDAIQFLPANK
ncbi:FAD-dependent oxidoreductase [Thalassoroseus pseudoceratinae]|uniref:FAD-dependent oxidoreductase n=1 Tax=Thalassoroseus pseudoceratinae TaxID=2713176 RepID=UPI001422485C|nr:FAD-dependent oxidoreductase [Thalassoroseus pseudoceratinae]